MNKPVLPKELRNIILSMFAEGKSSIEVFDAVCEQSIEYVKSENHLSRCIASLKGVSEKKQGMKANGSEWDDQGAETIPLPQRKPFECSKYEEIINTLDKTTPGYEVEKACHPIVIDILENYWDSTKLLMRMQAATFTIHRLIFWVLKMAKRSSLNLKDHLRARIVPVKLRKNDCRNCSNGSKGLTLPCFK